MPATTKQTVRNKQRDRQTEYVQTNYKAKCKLHTFQTIQTSGVAWWCRWVKQWHWLAITVSQI